MGRDARGELPLEQCLALLERKAPRPLTIQDMARMLDVEHYDRRGLRIGLERAVNERRLRRIGKTRYQWQRAAAEERTARRPAAGRARGGREISGRYARVRAGFGFVEAAGGGAVRAGRDVLIPAGMEGDARHGDTVTVAIERGGGPRGRTVGRVVAVTARAQETLVGALARSDGRTPRWLLVPLDDRLPVVEIIGGIEPTEADEGLIALVRPTRPAAATRPPGGTLEQVLGEADDPQVQFLSIVYEHGLRLEFPPAVLAEAAGLPEDPGAADHAGRRDLRELPFVTIDGESARDFDDAVCVADAPHGGTRLWVAIADVAHYVRPGSAIDAEAAARGTSVYFPDRAIPMLPPQLSSGLCSLLPGRDRLVLVAELVLDGAGARRSTECYRAVIRSRARLTYTQVAAVLSAAETAEIRAQRAALAALLPQLEHMLALMRVLYARRVRAGSLDLDLPEALVDLSEEGRSVGVRLLMRNDAHRLIEELMLAANVAVAEHLRAHDLPLPYRIHEPPVARDVDELNELLQPFGFAVEYDEEVRPADVQRLLDRLQGHRLARVLSRQVLRALRQARYSTENAGHFGLAFPIYCHFTSPIRRYPDLLVHRQLGRLFDGAADAARAESERLAADSARSSQAERGAMEAERAMLDLKKCEFMLEHLLEPEEATVVTVISAGAFVELDTYPIEGLVRADAIAGDRWVFVETERALKGLRTRQRLRLGDRVVVEAIDVSLQRRQIDFTIVRRLEAPPTPPARGKRPVARAARPRPARRAKARAT